MTTLFSRDLPEEEKRIILQTCKEMLEAGYANQEYYDKVVSLLRGEEA